MIVGIGVDWIEHVRVEQELAHGAWKPREGVFTESEIERCECGVRPGARYAACFAAKEATLKALGIEVADLGLLREVEVLMGRTAEHAIELHARTKHEAQRLGVKRIWLSIASTTKHAGAVVVMES